MMEKLPGQVKKSQLSTLAGRLKTWSAERYTTSVNPNSPIQVMTIIESEAALPVVPE
jgi:hypothetical protein